MEDQECKQILQSIKEMFNGRDPLEDFNTLTEEMTVDDLKKMVLIAANKIGTISKGGEYESSQDALMHLNLGVDQILTAYDAAMKSRSVMDMPLPTTSQVGTC